MHSAVYIARACNRLPHALDWGNNNLIIYAANHAIAIYDIRENNGHGKIVATLHKHVNRVNVVRWIRPSLPKLETEFMSVGTDGKIIIWSKNEPTSEIKLDSAVNLCDVIYFDEKSSHLLICSGTTNGDFKIWRRTNTPEIELLQNLDLSNKFALEGRLIKLSISSIILAIAIEDFTIELFAFNDSRFVKVQKLSGHENWVTSIDYTLSKSGEFMLASASEDKIIRLWKISQKPNEVVEANDLKTKKQDFLVNNEEYQVVLESVLSGHEAWVYDIHWHPKTMKLLSCSLDKMAIIWEPRGVDGVWNESVRCGEVGGNSLGFYGCKFGPEGTSFITYSYHGSFHMWDLDIKTNEWKSRTALGGHFNSVVDLNWDSKGRFLLSASLDQTTRIHAPWPIKDGKESWHEISRPQIHGHDMSCLSILNSCTFASGSEEKIIRIFTAPSIFHNYMQKISSDLHGFDPEIGIKKASVPSLGLTNKSITDNDDNEEVLIDYSKPPTEEELTRNTLWPEQQKLYGHGYEIFCMSARHDGTMLASASKTISPSLNHAAIILWDTTRWTQIQKLQAHRQTITQLAFSPDDKFLLSVSRDRRWALFNCQDNKYELLYISPEKGCLHTRIIWCCAWTGDSKYFATGSRDGTLGIWSKDIEPHEKHLPVTKLQIQDSSITALAFNDKRFGYVLAIGYESGSIDIKKIEKTRNSDTFEWINLITLNTSEAHHLAVKRLAFRPSGKDKQKTGLELASCGLDGLLKIHIFEF